MTIENYDKWKTAGRIAAESLDYGRGLIKKGSKVIDVCDAVDKKIFELGGKPAWPTQVSINETAAHFTSDEGDSLVFCDDLVSMDVGVHIDGFVGDNATSIDLSGKYSDIINAAKEALDAAIKTVKPGISVGEIGKAVQEAITSYGLSPVKNLSGHGISQWVIHDRPSIPSFNNNDKTKIEANKVIAIEPFVTNGVGMIAESERANIFSLVNKKPVRSPYAREILKYIEENYYNLVFTTRWLERIFGKGKTNIALKELWRLGIIQDHPPLIEKSKGIVAVFEKSMLVTEDKVEILTKID